MLFDNIFIFIIIFLEKNYFKFNLTIRHYKTNMSNIIYFFGILD